MYRALIVDDEIAARETLRCLIEWEKIGFEPPVCAGNGRQALELYENGRFDVVVTDVEMPLMGGLELIGEIRKRSQRQKIVIISCHERFDYARRAIKLGVEDYFIKDLLTAEELYARMLDISAELEGEAEPLLSLRGMDVSESVKCLLEGGSLTEEEIQLTRRDLGLENKQTIAAMSLVFDNRQQGAPPENRREITDILRADNLAEVELRENRRLVLFHAGDNVSMLQFMSGAIQHANHLRRRLREAGVLSVSIGISNQGWKLEELPTLYEQAEMVVGMRVVAGLNRNLLYSAVGAKRQTFNKEQLDRSIHEVKRLLEEHDARVLDAVRRLYAVNLIDGFMEFNYFKYLNARLYGVVFACAEKWNLSINQLFGEDAFEGEAVNDLETAGEMAEYFCTLLCALLGGKGEPPQEDGSLTEKAKRLIEQNLNRDISLNEIAELLHIHKGYLCRVFKEETGENLMQYVVNCKVEQAKKLLTGTSLKLYEISERLGFATPQYFSVVFKKQTGLTPNEYKKQ